MLRYLYLFAVVMICCGWGPTGLGGQGYVATGGGGTFTSFTDFPVGFEATLCSGETLSITEAGSEVDCDFSNTGLSMGGSEALNLTSALGDELHTVRIDFDAGDAPLDGNVLECHFMFRVETWGTSTALLAFFQSSDSVVLDGGYARVRNAGGSQGFVSAGADDFTQNESGSALIAEDTTYKICFVYDEPGDTTEVYVDASGGTYCAGAIGSVTHTGANFAGGATETANNGIDSVTISMNNAIGGTAPSYIYDDVDCGIQ